MWMWFGFTYSSYVPLFSLKMGSRPLFPVAMSFKTNVTVLSNKSGHHYLVTCLLSGQLLDGSCPPWCSGLVHMDTAPEFFSKRFHGIISRNGCALTKRLKWRKETHKEEERIQGIDICMDWRKAKRRWVSLQNECDTVIYQRWITVLCLYWGYGVIGSQKMPIGCPHANLNSGIFPFVQSGTWFHKWLYLVSKNASSMWTKHPSVKRLLQMLLNSSLCEHGLCPTLLSCTFVHFVIFVTHNLVTLIWQIPIWPYS